MNGERNWALILAELHRGWRRRWIIWAAIYIAGFGILWIAGMLEGWPFYGWAIGWALAKGIWDEARFRRAMSEQTGQRPGRRERE